MKDQAASLAAQWLLDCKVAALGTLHDGAPAVSMVPYAIVMEPLAFVVLVSGLSAHTRDMRADPRVGWMVMAEQRREIAQEEHEPEEAPPHMRGRVSMQARAVPIAQGSAVYLSARAAYSRRFADMTGLFELGDFSLFAIEPVSVRVVAGFARAHSVMPETLAKALATAADADG